MAALDYTSRIHDCVYFDGSWFGRRGTLRVYDDRVLFARKIIWPVWVACALALGPLLLLTMNLTAATSGFVDFALALALGTSGIVVLCVPLMVLSCLPLGLFLGKTWRERYHGKPALEIPAGDILGVEQTRCGIDRFAYALTLKDGRRLRFTIRNKGFYYQQFREDIEELILRAA